MELEAPKNNLIAENPEQFDPSRLYLDGVRQVTFGDFRSRIRQWAKFLSDHNIMPHDRVLISTRDDLAVMTGFIGSLYYGAVPAIIDPDLTRNEVVDVIGLVRPKAVIADEAVDAEWRLSELTPESLIISVPDPGGKKKSLVDKLLGRRQSRNTPKAVFPECLDGLAEAEVVFSASKEDPAYILFTSGTTSSTSKASVVPWRAAVAHITTMARQFDFSPHACVYNMQPLQHTDGLMYGALLSYVTGATLVRGPDFSIDAIPQIMEMLKEKPVTHIAAVPTMYTMLLNMVEETGPLVLPRLRYVLSSTAMLEKDLWERLQNFFGCRVTNHYGLTETVVAGLYCGPDDATWKMGTIGKPIDCDIRIVGLDGKDVPPGDVGELWMKGDLVFLGYLEDTETIASTLKDGWLPTGDLVRMDEDGFISVAGRIKNIIISGGKNINPEEIASVLNDHPEILEASVIGLQDPIWGENVAACIVPRQNSIDLKTLRDYCRANLAMYKVPRKFILMESLPKGISGKVRITELKAMVADMEEAGGSAGGDNLESTVIEIAAEAFGLAPSDLSLQSQPENTAQWDSFAHLNFVLGLENRLSIKLSPIQIMALDSIESAVKIAGENISKNGH